METLSRMQSEPRWAKLEQDSMSHATCSYLVLTAQSPFFMLWASRRWTQLTGYLVNDIIAYEVAALFGVHTQNAARVESLCEVVVNSQGARSPQHTVLSIPRRDGLEALVSLHVFPVFESTVVPQSQSQPQSPAPLSPKSPAPAALRAADVSTPQQLREDRSVCSDSTIDEAPMDERSLSISLSTSAHAPAPSPARNVAFLVLHFSTIKD